MLTSHIAGRVLACLSPLLLMGCIEKTTVANIDEAENILFTAQKQLLVSGGQNIYQITPKASGGFSQRELFDGNSDVGKYDCNFTGIAQKGEWVLTSCQTTRFLIFKNNHLLAAKVTEPNFKFRVISPSSNDPYDGLSLPNGLAFAPNGALLVADYNLFAASGIARVSLDFSGSLPRILSVQQNFVAPSTHGLKSPNGVRVSENLLYVSDANKVKRFQFDAQGRIPEYVTERPGVVVKNGKTLWSAAGAIVDDIMPFCNGVALTSYLSGRLHYVAAYRDAQGIEHFPVLYSSPPFGYVEPSSLALGAWPGVIGPDKLLVTEKGLLNAAGNKLSVSPLTLDLSDPGICAAIAELAREAVEG